MSDVTHLLRPLGQPEDDAEREQRHQLLATLLGAYVDNELPIETASQIDAHLLGCARCRSELRVQQSVRDRISRSTVPTATSELQSRIRQSIASTPYVVPTSTAPSSAHTWASRRVWIGALLVLVAALSVGLYAARNRAALLDPPPLQADSSIVVLQQMMQEYRRVASTDLPGRARDLDAVRQSLSFPVIPIERRDVHLLAAWTADLDGEPAAVLAYRWNDQVVLQYVVAESSLFRAHQVRAAFSARRALVQQNGAQGLIAWPDSSAGSVLIGDVPWQELAPLSRAYRH